GSAGAKKHAWLLFGSDDCAHVADRRAAMANGVAVGDFLVLVGLHEKPRPGPTEDGLQVGLCDRAIFWSHRAVDQLAIIVRRRRHIERAFLAALNLEAGNSGGAQRRQVVGQREVFHRERKAVARITFYRAAVAERHRGVGDFVGIAAGIGTFAAVAAAAEG